MRGFLLKYTASTNAFRVGIFAKITNGKKGAQLGNEQTLLLKLIANVSVVNAFYLPPMIDPLTIDQRF